MLVGSVFLVLPVALQIFPQAFPWLTGFPREVGRRGSAGERDATFAKTCFETAVGEWSAKTGNHPGSSLVFLALWYFDSSAHNPEVVGSSPASATKKFSHPFGWLNFFICLAGLEEGGGSCKTSAKKCPGVSEGSAAGGG